MTRAAVPDWKRLSLFEPQRPSRPEVAGGLAASIGALALLPLIVGGTAVVMGEIRTAAGIDGPSADEVLVPPPVEVVEARFVKLGSELDPRRLPDRYVPSLATAPATAGSEPDAVADPEPERAEPPPLSPSPPPDSPRHDPATPDRGLARPQAAPPARREARRPAEAREDALTRLGDRADALSTLTRPRAREGDPEGIPEGTETREGGDIYLGQLYTFFRRGWQVPSGIPDAELRELGCVIEVTLTNDARVGSWRIVRGSGNDAFDQSVRARISATEGSALPPPPAAEATRYLGRSITLRFLGRHGR